MDYEYNQKLQVSLYFHTSFSTIYSPCGALFKPYLNLNNPSFVYLKNTKKQASLIIRGGADLPLFETIKTNLGTKPKNELQQ